MPRFFACFKPMTSDGDSESTSRTEREFQAGSTGTQENRIVAYVELLRRPNEPLGLVLEGGADRDLPAYVAALRPGGVAEKSCALQIGDRILCINGTATERLMNAEVNALLQNAGHVINLEISFEAPPGADEDNDGIVRKTATIKLTRERNSFGFTISGGKTENRPITVSNVTVGSAAFRNGTLKVGDRILRINGADVSKASQMDTLSLLKASEDTCILGIEYDITLHEGLTETRGPLLVELLKPKGTSLGISLSGSPAHGEPIWISRVKEAGIADRCGALHIGDQLLSVNGVPLENKTINDVVQMLIHSELHVKLEIIPTHNFIDSDRPSFGSEEAFSDSLSHVARPLSSHSRPSRQSQISLEAITPQLLSHPETMTVTLKADNIGFGLSLQGGASEYNNFPLVIASIDSGGPGAKLGRLQVGDRILAINGERMDGVPLQQALKFVQEAGDTIDMEVEFDVTDAIVPTSGTFDVKMMKTESLNLGITINGSHQRSDPIWISNLKKGGIAYRMGMLQPGDVLLRINDQSLENANLHDAAQLLKGTGSVVLLRVSKDNANIVEKPEAVIYSVELNRHGQSLGITLTGSSHHPGHPVVISNIKEGGVAYKTGTMKAGDRVLAIDGESLFGKTLPEAVAMLSGAGDVVTLKISKATRKSRPRSKPVSPPGRNYKYGGGGSREGRSRASVTPSHPRLSRMDSYGSSVHMQGGMRRRLPSSSHSGRSTPESHSTISLEHSVLSSPHPRLHEGLLDRNSRLLAPDHRSAFSRPGSLGLPRLRGGGSPYSSGLTSTDLLRLNQSIGGQNRGSFTETDEEMSHEEDYFPRGRRVSAPLYSPFEREARWDFKPRRSSYAHHRIPIGRVSPLTPSDSTRNSVTSLFSSKPEKVRSKHSSSSGVTSPVGALGTRQQQQQQQQPPDETDAGTAKRDYEATIYKSGEYIQQLKRLAESGSSDPDSDSEPHGMKTGELPPHLQDRLMQHMKSAMTPARMEPHTVELEKDGASDFGFSLSDGMFEPGVYVKAIRPGGPADVDQKLQHYDRILKINDTVVKDFDCCKIVPVLEQAGERIVLIVARNPLAGEGDR